MNDEDESKTLKQRIDTLKKNLQNMMLEKHHEIQEVCIISVSGNHNTLGQVISCNNEIGDLLEFY